MNLKGNFIPGACMFGLLLVGMSDAGQQAIVTYSQPQPVQTLACETLACVPVQTLTGDSRETCLQRIADNMAARRADRRARIAARLARCLLTRRQTLATPSTSRCHTTTNTYVPQSHSVPVQPTTAGCQGSAAGASAPLEPTPADVDIRDR